MDCLCDDFITFPSFKNGTEDLDLHSEAIDEAHYEPKHFCDDLLFSYHLNTGLEIYIPELSMESSVLP